MSDHNDSSQAGFRSFDLNPILERGIDALGFKQPRAIQAATIPAALEGRDILGLAQTGTGKTAAFALPILDRILAGKPCGPRALVLAPTRELAMQIHAEFCQLAKFTKVKAMTVYGGVSAHHQIRALRDGVDVVIACPGRMLDLIRQRHADLRNVEVLVLDEADHMFDIGFLPDVRRIMNTLPKERQNMLFSATMPKEIRGLAESILKNPHKAELTQSGPATTIEHALYPVAEEKKIDLLKHLLEGDAAGSAIVFSRTRHRAKRLARQLEKVGHGAIALQGDMSQGQRDRAMKGFRSGHFKVLVATDVAARGIDVAAVSQVINFDMPSTPEAYTHRIGRTGRGDNSGKAHTFISGSDGAAVRALERKLGAAIERRVLPGFEGSPAFTDQRGATPQRPNNPRRSRPGRPAPPRRRNRNRTRREPGSVADAR